MGLDVFENYECDGQIEITDLKGERMDKLIYIPADQIHEHPDNPRKDLMESKDQTADVQAAVNACKEENAYMFGDDEPINNPIGQTGGQTVTPPGKNPEDMSYEEYRAWREGK